jgi:peptide chain release factor 2
LAEQAERRRGSVRDLRQLQNRLDGLESEVGHLAFLVRCKDVGALCDGFLTLRLVASHGGKLDGVAILARMYRELALRRGLATDVLDDRSGADAVEDTITFRISGPGAFALLVGEDGIHQLTRGKRQTRNGKRRPADREVIRVEVLPAPLGEASFGKEEVRCEVRALVDTKGRLGGRLKHEVRMFHLSTMTALEARLDGSKSEALDRLRPLLLARIEAIRKEAGHAESTRMPTIRRYTLGPTTLVRDTRSGRTTGRLDQILQGYLEPFLQPPPYAD